MKALPALLRCVFVSLLVGASAVINADSVRVANTDLVIFGLGNAQELRTEVFMGALYLPANVKSIDEARDETVPKRMTLKILQDNWSNREMVRKTKERIALNNARAVWQAQGQYILDFSAAFQESLRRGDRIDIDHVPGQGVKVYGNGTLLKSLKSTSFFNLLLNAWIGDNPPAQSFKNGILGQNDKATQNNLIASYEALLPLPNRSFAAVKEPEPVKAEAKPEPTTKAVVATKPADKAPDLVVAKVDKLEPKPAETKPADVKPTESKAVDAKPAETKPVETKVAEVKKPEPKPVAPLTLDLSDALLEQAFIDPDLLFGDYKRDAIQLFRQNVKYPIKALKEKVEGEGIIRVMVDVRGNLLGTEVLESTRDRNLDRAMVDMVNKTMPLPAMPKELPDEPYSIDIPIKFSL